MYKKTNSGHRCAFSVALMTLGMLMRETKSFKCSRTKERERLETSEKAVTLRFPGLYLLNRMLSSVKIPICARSKLRPASRRPMTSSKCPRCSYILMRPASSSYVVVEPPRKLSTKSVLTACTIIFRPQIWARRNSDFSMHAAWTCFQTLKSKRQSMIIRIIPNSLGVARLSGTFHCGLVLPEVNESRG